MSSSWFYEDEVSEPDAPPSPLDKFIKAMNQALSEPIKNYVLSWDRQHGKTSALENLNAAMSESFPWPEFSSMNFGTSVHAAQEAFLEMGDNLIKIKSIEIKVPSIETPREKALRLRKEGHSRSAAHGFDLRGRKL